MLNTLKLTIIYSSHLGVEYNKNFNEYLKNTSGLKPNEIEVLSYENYNQYSLNEVYNKGLDESKSNYVIFIHNDIKIEKNWGVKIIKHLDKNTHSIIGVAGTVNLPKSGRWWDNPVDMRGIVKHSQNGKTWENKYSESQGYEIKDVVILDGLFLGVNKNKIKHRFDEDFKGFHFYDLGFCYPNYLDDVKLGVITDIRITHMSIGQTNQQWEENRKQFVEKYYNKFKQSVKILTGWSNAGGSTTALINLTNELNKYNYDVTLYGPHTYHLDKCKSGNLNKANLTKEDIVISHFLDIPNKLDVKKHILSCHEKDLFKVGEKQNIWDTVVFLNQRHRDYHNTYNSNYVIIPNLRQDLKPTNKNGLEKICGIIGSFDYNKQTHISIERAINDNMVKIYLYGEPNNSDYYLNTVKPLIDNKRVILKGFKENKQQLYSEIGSVYHSSISEVASLVKDECYLTNTIFNGNESTNTQIVDMTNEEIIQEWIKLLK